MDQSDEYGEPDAFRSEPPGGRLWPAAAGLLAFFASWAVGVGITILVIRALSPKVGHPAEANEGLDDFVTAMLRLALGIGVSFAVALVVGVVVSSRAASRQMTRRAGPPTF